MLSSNLKAFVVPFNKGKLIRKLKLSIKSQINNKNLMCYLLLYTGASLSQKTLTMSLTKYQTLYKT